MASSDASDTLAQADSVAIPSIPPASQAVPDPVVNVAEPQPAARPEDGTTGSRVEHSHQPPDPTARVWTSEMGTSFTSTGGGDLSITANDNGVEHPGGDDAGEWEDVETDSDANDVALQSGADAAAVASVKRRVLLITNEVSKQAKCGDWATNEKYEDLMDGVEKLLRKSVAPGNPLANRILWEHRLFESERKAFHPPDYATEEVGDCQSSGAAFVLGDAREATDVELCREGVHSQRYLDEMAARTAEAVAKLDPIKARNEVLEEFRGKSLPSAGFALRTESAARAGTASLIDATRAVLNGEFSTAFVLCRPPTHHAVGNEARVRNTSPKLMPYGFCHLNGISSAVAAARDALGKEHARNDPAGAFGPPQPQGRIAILDVDVHAGNGNEDTWYGEADVLHVNLSEAQIWPGNEHGDPRQVGAKGAELRNLNFPMPSGESDAAYVYVLTQHALPAIRAFQPSLIIVACGFDALDGDPYASMALSPTWFGWLAAELHECAIAPFVFNLEGGYDPDLCCMAAKEALAGLARTVTAASFLQRLKLVARAGSSAKQYTHRGTEILLPRSSTVDAVLEAVALHADPKSNLGGKKKKKGARGGRGQW